MLCVQRSRLLCLAFWQPSSGLWTCEFVRMSCILTVLPKDLLCISGVSMQLREILFSFGISVGLEESRSTTSLITSLTCSFLLWDDWIPPISKKHSCVLRRPSYCVDPNRSDLWGQAFSCSSSWAVLEERRKIQPFRWHWHGYDKTNGQSFSTFCILSSEGSSLLLKCLLACVFR